MSNPDEKRKATYSQLSKTIIYYACGVIFTGTIALLGLQLFHDYFYGSGMNELFPSLILIFFSLVGGFSISKFLLKRINNKRKEWRIISKNIDTIESRGCSFWKNYYSPFFWFFLKKIFFETANKIKYIYILCLSLKLFL